MSERDSRLAQIVGRDFHIHAVPNTDADEILAHLSRDMGQDLMAIGQGHAKHGARQHLGHRSLQCNRFFFCHEIAILSIPSA